MRRRRTERRRRPGSRPRRGAPWPARSRRIAFGRAPRPAWPDVSGGPSRGATIRPTASAGNDVEGDAETWGLAPEREGAVPHVGGEQHQLAGLGLDEALRRQRRAGGDARFAEAEPALAALFHRFRQG